jgi:hypothetical protein
VTEPPSCQRYKPGQFLAVRPLKWDEIITEDNNDGNRVDSGAPSGGWLRCSDGNDNDEGKGNEGMQGSDKGTGKGKRKMYGKGKDKGKTTEEGKEKGKGNGKEKGMFKQKSAGDDISGAVAWQLQKEMNGADSDTEG